MTDFNQLHRSEGPKPQRKNAREERPPPFSSDREVLSGGNPTQFARILSRDVGTLNM
ncbi:hypothetical protein OROGR_019979 [Orobanche gracilis]